MDFKVVKMKMLKKLLKIIENGLKDNTLKLTWFNLDYGVGYIISLRLINLDSKVNTIDVDFSYNYHDSSIVLGGDGIYRIFGPGENYVLYEFIRANLLPPEVHLDEYYDPFITEAEL